MPKVERLAFVCDMRVGKTGVPGRAHFYEAVIRSHARLTYDQAWRFLADPADTSDSRADAGGARIAARSSTRSTAR